MTEVDKSIEAPAPTTPTPEVYAQDKSSDVPTQREAESVPASEGQDAANTGQSFEELANKKGFKSPEDMARSYKELESKLSQTSMSKAELEKARPSDVTEDAARESLEAKIKNIEEKMELRELFGAREDAKDYAKQMADYVKDNPNASWETAYKVCKFDDLETTSRQAGRDEALGNLKDKVASRPESPSPSESKVKSLSDMIADPNTPLSEIEKQLPHG